MKRFRTLFLFVLLFSPALPAGAETDGSRVKIRFGGRIDAQLFTDTYNSKTTNGGILYYFPLAPAYTSQGADINRVSTLRFGVASSRINLTVTAPDLLGAEARGYVETDFMGSGDVLGVLRLRHAYVGLNWRRSQLLVGQTNNLSVPEEITPNTVAFGAGVPFNPLSRIPQIRYTRQVGESVRLSAAVGMYAGKEGEAQACGLVPDFAVRLTAGGPDALVGFSGAVKSIRPRNLTADSVRTTRRMTAFSASAFALYRFGGGHRLSVFVMWGQDLSTLNLLGGYGPRLSETERGEADYGYTATQTVATWIEFETRTMKGWQPGLLVGWTKNLGSGRAIDLAQASIPDRGIDRCIRVAPRLWYHYRQLSFGLEYLYNSASWGRVFDRRYRPTERYADTQDHRLTLLARFKF